MHASVFCHWPGPDVIHCRPAREPGMYASIPHVSNWATAVRSCRLQPSASGRWLTTVEASWILHFHRPRRREGRPTSSSSGSSIARFHRPEDLVRGRGLGNLLCRGSLLFKAIEGQRQYQDPPENVQKSNNARENLSFTSTHKPCRYPMHSTDEGKAKRTTRDLRSADGHQNKESG